MNGNTNNFDSSFENKLDSTVKEIMADYPNYDY